MMGKSAATMRRSSAATWSSSAATGRWMSPSEARIAFSLASPRGGGRFPPPPDAHEGDAAGKPAAIQPGGFGGFPLPPEGAGEPVQDAEPLLVAGRRQLERAPQDRFRHDRRALFE